MDLAVIWDSLPKMLEGSVLTIQLTVFSLLIGLVFAVPVALMRLSKNVFLTATSYVYVLYFRGTPLLVQLFLIYYGAGQFREFFLSVSLWDGVFAEAYFCALLTLTLNTCAYTSEIFRGSIQAVPRGEVEAAKACGMSKLLTFWRIVLPKAFRYALPAYINEVVFLFQATSLVSLVTLLDLTGMTGRAIAKSFAVYELYIAAGLMYLCISYLIIFAFKKLEHRLNGHLRDRPISDTATAIR